MGFNALDWFIVAYLGLWVILILWGLKRGLIREVMTIVGLVVGLVCANMWADEMAAGLNRYVGKFDYWIIVAYVIIILLALLVAVIIGRGLHKLFDAAQLGWLNRTLGALVGVVKGGVLAMVIVLLVSMAVSSEAGCIKNSKLAPKVRVAVVEVYQIVPKHWRDSFDKQRDTWQKYIQGALGKTLKPKP